MHAVRADPETSCGWWQDTHRLCASEARPSIVAIVVWQLRHERGPDFASSPWGTWHVVQRSTRPSSGSRIW